MARAWVTIGWCMAALLPLLARGVSTSRHELVEALHSTPNLDRGAELFDTCAACHATSGSGTRDGAVPRIASQPAAVIVKQLVDFHITFDVTLGFHVLDSLLHIDLFGSTVSQQVGSCGLLQLVLEDFALRDRAAQRSSRTDNGRVLDTAGAQPRQGVFDALVLTQHQGISR